MSDLHSHEHHEHGENCTCGCGGEHGHSHHENHEHNHGAHATDGSLIMSVSRKVPHTVSSEEAAKQVKKVLCQIAEKLAVDGIIFGHIKALLKSDSAYIAYSMTQTDHVSTKTSGSFASGEAIEIVFNIHSMHHAEPVSESDVINMLGY